MHSTLTLFEYLYKHLPPLIPQDIKEAIGLQLHTFKKNKTHSLAELEDTMITYGYKIWPYVQAYREFYQQANEQVGEHFLLPKLSDPLHQRYLEFKNLGGTLTDLQQGKRVRFFTPEERSELCMALIGMQSDLHLFVKQELSGVEKKVYLKRVKEFTQLLQTFKTHLEELKSLADSEKDHPSLANDMRAQIRGFEEGFCLLGPEPHFEAICQSVDYFKGRKEHLSRLKGIHLPLEVDFYAD
jgi:hypothetical protein